MTLNEAIHRLCQQARSSIDEMRHLSASVSDPDSRSALAEDIGRLQEALVVVAESGLERRDVTHDESFIEFVRDRL
jgi:hypothetical protein